MNVAEIMEKRNAFSFDLCGENSDENSDEPPTMFTFALILLL